MDKFKVGDIVIGNAMAGAIYSRTQTGWIGKVVHVYANTMDVIYHAIPGHDIYEDDCQVYNVDFRYFDLYRPAKTNTKVDYKTQAFMLMGQRITKVIYNDPATIVFWSDGEKTVVKCQGTGRKKEKFDKEKGLAMCIAKRALGNRSNFNNVINAFVNDEK